jgi:hypothetical protein
MAHRPFIRSRAKPLPHSAPVPQVVVLEISAFFEERSSSSDNSSCPYSLLGHRRTGSEPAAPRLPSPYTQTSQSNPTFTTTTYDGFLIQSIASVSPHTSSVVSGSRSYAFLPPMDIIPDIFDFSLFQGLALDPCLGNRRCVPNDGMISDQSIVYRGDPWAIAYSRSCSLRRTTSMVDLGEDFESAL